MSMWQLNVTIDIQKSDLFIFFLLYILIHTAYYTGFVDGAHMTTPQ